MIDELMMRFAQIRSSYAKKMFGNLSNEDKALIDYESFCLELIKEVDQLKDVVEKARENINELIEHYKRLLNAEYNQEISVFVDKTHKNMFISNVVSSLEVMKIYILDKVGDIDE